MWYQPKQTLVSTKWQSFCAFYKITVELDSSVTVIKYSVPGESLPFLENICFSSVREYLCVSHPMSLSVLVSQNSLLGAKLEAPTSH